MKDPIQEFMDSNICTSVEFLAKGRPSPFYNNDIPQQNIVRLTNELTSATYSFGLTYLDKPELDHLVGKSFEHCKQYLEQAERQAYDHYVKHKVRKSHVTFGNYISSGRNND